MKGHAKLINMDIKEISQEIHKDAKEKGFWDFERNIGEILMLVVSELGEALEADRKGQYFSHITDIDNLKERIDKGDTSLFKAATKDKFEDEIADACIRLFDLAEGLGIDLEWHIRAKLDYNKSRPKLHGKKY